MYDPRIFIENAGNYPIRVYVFLRGSLFFSDMRLFRLIGLGLVLFFTSFTFLPAQFVELGNALGVDLGGRKDGGAAWGDFNGDGCPDILVNTDNNTGRSRIYLSDCDLANGPAFTDVTSTHAAGLLRESTERCAIWADFNNDGYLDFGRNGNDLFEIYINKGPTATPPYSFGTIIQDPNLKITTISGGMNVEGFGWMDYNGDGWLDLILENHNFGIDIFENPADGTANFFHVTPNGATKGLPSGATTGDYMCLSDYNNDGYVDILARKQNEFDLWQNNGPLAATQFQANIGFNENADNGNKGGVLFADFNNDGFFDLFWTDRGSNTIYLGDGAGNFAVTSQPEASSGVSLFNRRIDGCAAADVNNDGKIDLFLSDGSGPSYLYLNTTPYGGALNFTRDNLGIDVDEDGEGLAFGDYDLDGDLDLYINVRNGNNQLWQNGDNSSDYLYVRAFRDLGNGIVRDDIGATVVLKDCNGVVRSGIRDVNGTRGHGSQDAPKIHFGLPDGNGAVYVVEISFTYVNGTRTVIQQAVIPSVLTDQTLEIANTEVGDLSLCQTLSASGIISFSATGGQSGVGLKWRLNGRESGSVYEIEHSSNGKEFQTLGRVIGASGYSDSYEYFDQNPTPGVGYYRILRKQNNGEASYSSILTFTNDIKDGLKVLEHPVQPGADIELQLDLSEAGLVHLELFDVSGKLVMIEEVNLDSGNNHFALDRSELKSGMYLLKVSGSGLDNTERLLLR